MRSILAAILIILSAAPALAECPPGAYEWLGHNGTRYCRRNVIGLADGIEACPAGTRAVTNGWARACERIRPAPSKPRAGPAPH